MRVACKPALRLRDMSFRDFLISLPRHSREGGNPDGGERHSFLTTLSSLIPLPRHSREGGNPDGFR